MNTSLTTWGERVTTAECNSRISEAKQAKLDQFYYEHGYYFCEDCGANEYKAGKIDCSHEIGIDKAKKLGKTELCWSVENIKLRCRICHQKHDKNQINYK